MKSITDGPLVALSNHSVERVPVNEYSIDFGVFAQDTSDAINNALPGSSSGMRSLLALHINGVPLFLDSETMTTLATPAALNNARTEIAAMLNRDGCDVDEVADKMSIDVLALLTNPEFHSADVEEISRVKTGSIRFADADRTGINIVTVGRGEFEIIKTSCWSLFVQSGSGVPVYGKSDDILTATTRYRVSLKDSAPRFLIDVKKYLGLNNKFTSMLDVKYGSTIHRSEDKRVLNFLKGREASLATRIWNHIRSFFTGEVGVEIRRASDADVTALNRKLPNLCVPGPDRQMFLTGPIQTNFSDQHTWVTTRARGKSTATASIETVMTSGRSQLMTHVDRFLGHKVRAQATTSFNWRNITIEAKLGPNDAGNSKGKSPEKTGRGRGMSCV